MEALLATAARMGLDYDGPRGRRQKSMIGWKDCTWVGVFVLYIMIISLDGDSIYRSYMVSNETMVYDGYIP